MFDHWMLRVAVFVTFILPRLLLLYVLPILIASLLLGWCFARFMAPFVWGLSHPVP